MSDRAKVGFGVLAVAAAVALFIVLQDGNDDSSEPAVQGEPTAAPNENSQAGQPNPKPAPVPVIRLQGGQPVGGVKEVEVTSGERVRFRVVSDAAGKVHVHGYDDEQPVAVGEAASFDFPATLEGGYEIELHGADGAHSQIGELRVQPG